MTGVKHGVDNRVNMNLPHTSKPEGCGTRIRLDTSLYATVDCAQQFKDPAHFGEGTRRF